ncbi:Isochorismatase-like protein asqB, partial [Fusarium oxysporum f. sp. albedinis]
MLQAISFRHSLHVEGESQDSLATEAVKNQVACSTPPPPAHHWLENITRWANGCVGKEAPYIDPGDNCSNDLLFYQMGVDGRNSGRSAVQYLDVWKQLKIGGRDGRRWNGDCNLGGYSSGEQLEKWRSVDCQLCYICGDMGLDNEVDDCTTAGSVGAHGNCSLCTETICGYITIGL